jgi:hypothetical protein
MNNNFSYKTLTTLLGELIIVRSDNAYIPADEGNSDYRQYLAWVAEGNTAEEWNPE